MRNGLGSKIRNNPSSLFEKNREDSPLMMFYTDGRILSYLTDMSERLAQMIQFILTIFFYAGWHQMIVMETACLQTVEIYYCGGFVPLFVTMCHGLSSCVLPWINTVVFYQLILYQLSWRLSNWIIMTMLMMLPVEWYVCAQDHTSLARREC